MPSTSKPSRARAHEPEGRVALSSSPACFEPFGEDWSNARSFGLNLRLPGQWDDPYWHRDMSSKYVGADLYYNVHRWYEPGTGRYVSADPLDVYSRSAKQVFGYAFQNPLRLVDRLGLFAIDPTCDGTMCIPGAAGIPRLDQMRELKSLSCAQLASQITDTYVRSCTETKCNNGKLSCEDPHPQGCSPKKDGVTMAYCLKSRPGKVFICPNNWAPFAGGFVGDVIIHEFAHSCGWRHGDDQGVPFDPGFDFSGSC